MRGNAQPYHAQESARQAEQRLDLLLAGATDQRVRSFTVDSLAATHRVKFPVIAQKLAACRARRGLANG